MFLLTHFERLIPVIKVIPYTVIALIFTSLTAVAKESGTSYAKWNERRGVIFSSGEETETLDGVTIPHLVSHALAEKWGKPELWILKDGSYGVRYRNPDPDSPFEVVTILGFAAPLQALTSIPDQGFDEMVNGELTSVQRPQQWKSIKVSIAGVSKEKQKLRYFREYAGGGADGPRDSTDTFTLISERGNRLLLRYRRYHYRCHKEATEDALPEVKKAPVIAGQPGAPHS